MFIMNGIPWVVNPFSVKKILGGIAEQTFMLAKKQKQVYNTFIVKWCSIYVLKLSSRNGVLALKVLSIGNSFSQDAQKWLSRIAQSCGEDIYAVNLYIGSCSLERHWNNFVSQAQDYDLEINSECIRKISVNEALQLEKWDVITLQQASPQCGDYSTYQPYLTNLYEQVKKACPDAKIFIHQTWSYEIDCSLEAFDNYDRSQRIMDERSMEAYRLAARDIGVRLIPCGDMVRYLRKNLPEFDYANGGKSINRDGFHLSFDYGRYAAGVTWYAFLTGKDPREVTFVPVVGEQTAETELLKKINQAVYAVLHN